MALALAIAWLVEWVSWREAQTRAVAPRVDQRLAVEEALPEPEPESEAEPEPPSMVETDPPPAAEKAPDPVAVEADHEPVRLPPGAFEAPEPAEAAAEPETHERRSEPQPDQAAPKIEASQAPAPRARRARRGMSLRRVDRPGATTPGEPPTPAESDPVEVAEPAAASGFEPPGEVESRPEPEPQPAYAHPRVVSQPPAYEPAPVVPRAPANVVRMPRSSEPREWNVWELESLAREQARLEPERGEEWSYLFVHLRQFADANGQLPSEFDGLVRESFGELLETLELA
jgi:ribonuclease E